MILLVVRGNILDTSSHTVGSLQQSSYKESVCLLSMLLDGKVMPAFSAQAVSRTASLESHLNASYWPTQDMQQQILKMLSHEKERMRRRWRQEPPQISFLIISHPKMDDGNKDTDSKTLNGCFCLGIKGDTYANTYILPKYFHQRYIALPERKGTELPKHSNS